MKHFEVVFSQCEENKAKIIKVDANGEAKALELAKKNFERKYKEDSTKYSYYIRQIVTD